MDKIFFMVKQEKRIHFVWALNREYAKSYASLVLGGDPDNYIVTPLTEMGDIVSLGVIVLSN